MIATLSVIFALAGGQAASKHENALRACQLLRLTAETFVGIEYKGKGGLGSAAYLSERMQQRVDAVLSERPELFDAVAGADGPALDRSVRQAATAFHNWATHDDADNRAQKILQLEGDYYESIYEVRRQLAPFRDKPWTSYLDDAAYYVLFGPWIGGGGKYLGRAAAIWPDFTSNIGIVVWNAYLNLADSQLYLDEASRELRESIKEENEGRFDFKRKDPDEQLIKFASVKPGENIYGVRESAETGWTKVSHWRELCKVISRLHIKDGEILAGPAAEEARIVPVKIARMNKLGFLE